jgi:hypothetical protein
MLEVVVSAEDKSRIIDLHSVPTTEAMQLARESPIATDYGL